MSQLADSTAPQRLLAEFPPVSPADWRAEAEKALEGAPFDKKLVTPTYEGIALQPIYHGADAPTEESLPGQFPFVRGSAAAGYARQPWAIAQENPVGDPVSWNVAARAEADAGMNTVRLTLDVATQLGHDADAAGAGEVGACGLSLSSAGDVATALASLPLARQMVQLEAGAGVLPVAAVLHAGLRQLGQLPVSGALDADPLGALAQRGALTVSLDQAYRELAATVQWHADHAPQWTVVCASGNPYAEAGGSATQELGFALATAVEYLRALEARGVPVATVLPRLRFSFSVGRELFTEIAKFRAARLLWARIVEALGQPAEMAKVKLHARTNLYHKTVLDPYVNLLRTTTEGFAAVAGGVDSLTTGAFDEVLRLPTDDSRRWARNLQIILQEECHLMEVADPAGGSFYIETLTRQVADKAWTVFQTVEKRGGMSAALAAGFPQNEVKATAGARLKKLAQRRDVLVGTNLYPNLTEKPLPVAPADDVAGRRAAAVATWRANHPANEARQTALLAIHKAGSAGGTGLLEAAIQAAASGATLGEVAQAVRAHLGGQATVPALATGRLAAPYEALRAAASRYRVAHGHLPKVFLANQGPLKQHKARADFIQGFFESGGFAVNYAKGAKTPAETVDALQADGAKIVVLCSTDDTYPTLVPEVTKAIKAARPDTIVLLAGIPAPEHEAAYTAAGLDGSISIKSDHLATLEKYLKLLGAL